MTRIDEISLKGGEWALRMVIGYHRRLIVRGVVGELLDVGEGRERGVPHVEKLSGCLVATPWTLRPAGSGRVIRHRLGATVSRCEVTDQNPGTLRRLAALWYYMGTYRSRWG